MRGGFPSPCSLCSLKWLIFFVLLLCLSIKAVNIPTNITAAAIMPLTLEGQVYNDNYSGIKFGTWTVNNNSSFLPNTTLLLDVYNTDSVPSTALSATIQAIESGIDILLCCYTSNEATIAAVASTVYQKVMLSSETTSTTLSDRVTYPYFARIVPPDDYQAKVFVDILQTLSNQTGQVQYLEVGIIITTGSYGVGGATQLINSGELTIKSYQQFLTGATDLSVELSQLQSSGARVFIAVIGIYTDMFTVLSEGLNYDIIGDHYIWMCFDGCSSDYIFYSNFSAGTINSTVQAAAMGMIGVTIPISNGAYYPQMNSVWKTLNSTEYPGAGTENSTLSLDNQYYFDTVYFLAAVMDNLILAGGLESNGTIISTDQYYSILKNTTVLGVTGEIILDSIGNRKATYNVLNLRNETKTFSNIGYWDTIHGLNLTIPFEFHDGTENPPDLDIRPPFNYWSCPDKEEKTDPTGKTITIQKPDGSNPPYIAEKYHCDNFIDCSNISDESVNCGSNYVILFIIFGIITGLCIILCFLYLLFTILFGFIFPRKRVRAASPSFLIIVIISCIFGFASVYSWFGKPQTVACNFQPWLLGLGIVSLVAALFAKTFRIWRIFKTPFNRKSISDLELMVLWVAMVVPAIFILFLWTLISTPTAAMRNVDSKDHLVCTTGGFTGPPGSFVFFFIFVGYTGLLLVFGGFLTIVTRKVPSLFNESKLIAISIYNLVFLSVVVIPVVIVLNNINPFASWIIRTVGILYAFLATLTLQFFPKFFAVIFIDRFKDIQLNANALADMGNTNTASGMG